MFLSHPMRTYALLILHPVINSACYDVGTVNKLVENMNSCLFWDKTQCRLLKVNRPFEVTCRLHSQDGRKIQGRNQPEAGNFLSKRRLTFKGIHSFITQNVEIFITTAVRTSHPTQLIPWFSIRCNL
jgi:hypothetical protein